MTHISQSAAKTANVTRQQTARDKIRISLSRSGPRLYRRYSYAQQQKYWMYTTRPAVNEQLLYLRTHATRFGKVRLADISNHNQILYVSSWRHNDL